MKTIVVLSACLALLACTAPAHADPPLEPPAPTVPAVLPTPAPIVIATYDGHTAQWWAQRSRAAHMHVRHLQAALRERLPITGGLASAFLCIHSFEGSWTDPNPPFFGGVQMDLQFARTYGGEFLRAWGTPDHWPAFVQVAVAMRAYFSGRGFYPWPNTARYCGLL